MTPPTSTSIDRLRWRLFCAIVGIYHLPPSLEAILDQALGILSQRDLEVLKRRFGFYDHPCTLKETGAMLGVTGARVRQIENHALHRLRHLFGRQCRSQLSREDITSKEVVMDTVKVNAELESIEADLHRRGLEYGPGGDLVDVTTPWAMGAVVFASKSKPMADLSAKLAQAMFGNDPRKGVCAVCGKPIAGFRDEASRREYSISGMCQECQDAIFSR